jgi:hypothetical protein
MDKKIYIIDRNGRMHLISLELGLMINGVEVNSAEDAEAYISNLFADRKDITFKTLTHLKVFDSNNLIGFQIVPSNE